jgi:hypothetical protein
MISLSIKRIAQKIPVILSSRWFPFIAVVFGLLLTFSSIWSGWFTDDYWHRIGYSDSPKIEEIFGDYSLTRLTGPMRAYSFLKGEEEKVNFAKNQGMMPWWTDSKSHICLWRPIAGLLLDVDYSFWPQTPGLMHLHSLIWFAGLIFAVSILFKNIMGAVWAAGLAALLFAIDDSHAWPVVFLANRHTLLAVFFGALSIWSFDHWRKKDQWQWRIAYIMTFTLSILSSEGGIAVLAFYMSYLLFLDKKCISSKIRALVPIILIIVIWRVVYNVLGYGAIGNELYIDPVREPIIFISTVMVRLPILVLGLVGLPPSMIYMALSGQGAVVYSITTYLILISLAIITFPLWKKCSISHFWGCAMILACIPLCSALPGNRNLGLPSIGALGLIAQLCYNFIQQQCILIKSSFRRFTIWSLLGFGFVIHLIIYPAILCGTPFAFKMLQQGINHILKFSEWDEQIESKDAIFVNTPNSLLFSFCIPFRILNDLPVPKHIRILSPGREPVQIKRIDEQILSVIPDLGFVPPVSVTSKKNPTLLNYINPKNADRRFERIILRRDTAFHVGQQVNLDGVRIEVVSITEDKRPLEVRYTFECLLEDETLVWYFWDMKHWKFAPFTLPEIGETMVVQ